MKRIYSFLFTVIATLAFVPFVSAQPGTYSIKGQINETIEGETVYLEWPKENGVHNATDFAYSKDISAPQSDGTYWIKLESFSTGAATYVESAAPADIVLVLDFSNSMTAEYYTTGTHYVPRVSDRNANYQGNSNPAGSFDYNNTGTNTSTNNTYYIDYDGNYYLVNHGRGGNNNQYYYLSFEVNGTTYYLDGDHVSTDMPTTYLNQYAPCWTGALYRRYNNQSVSRVNALKEAVSDFIDVIYHNDNYDDEGVKRSTPLGNRISIVVFSANNTTDSRQIAGWTDVTTASGTKDETLVRRIAAVTDNPRGTYSNRGMSLANTLLEGINADRKLISTRTVVMFTDGVPGNYTSWSDQYESTTTAHACIAQAKISKNTHDATVFTVALYSWSSTIQEGSNEEKMRKYLNYVSSNFKNADDLDHPNTGTGDVYDGLYRKDAGQDLSAVFREIAHQSGGSSTTLSAASSNVDVVSNSFVLPEGADADNIDKIVKIFVAKHKESKTQGVINGEHQFYEEYLIGHAPDDYVYYELDENGERVSDTPKKVDATIRVSLEGDNKIKVTGFDYSSCFCGPVYEENWDPKVHSDEENLAHVDHYQGYKIIIMIPIKMNPDAVGGPNVQTNGPGSGIYVSDGAASAFVAYESPTVSLPVNIYLEKIGLKPGESAKFKIERAVIPNKENWDPETDIAENAWTYVSTVFVTNGQYSKLSKNGNPMVKVRGMPATITLDEDGDGEPDEDDEGKIIQLDVVYRITEEPWAWSYDILDTDEYPNPQYTVTSKVDNPFSYKNEPKENIDVIVRHAESKATNVFKTLGDGEKNERYDDSKKNVRNSGESE